VQRGKDAEVSYKHNITFPTLTEKAAKLYIGAYGKDRYDNYAKKFDDLGNGIGKANPVKNPKECIFLHCPHHDMESVIWVLIDGLVHAWPKSTEPEVRESAKSIMRILNTHTILVGGDSRKDIESYDEDEWTQSLHPDLQFLAPMMTQIGKFLSCNWTLWMDPKDENPLKADFLHEALKQLLLEEIVNIDSEKNKNVALYDKLRCIPDGRDKFQVVNRQTCQPVTLRVEAQRPQPVTLLEDRNEDGEIEGLIEVENEDSDVEETDEPETEDEDEGTV
jgi:hypothetical protein